MTNSRRSLDTATTVLTDTSFTWRPLMPNETIPPVSVPSPEKLTSIEVMAVCLSQGISFQLVNHDTQFAVDSTNAVCSDDALAEILEQIKPAADEIKRALRIAKSWYDALRSNELATMPYAEYLNTDEWKALRDAAIDRADGRCQVCNKEGSLHAHHRTYERRGREAQADLIALCGDCHKLFHDNGRLVK